MLSDLQRRHEAAVARLGQLEGEREQRLALEERARSLTEAEAREKTRAEHLEEEVKQLRHRLTWRTVEALAIGAGVAAIAALLWLRFWWPG
jgi:hypothetical protein